MQDECHVQLKEGQLPKDEGQLPKEGLQKKGLEDFRKFHYDVRPRHRYCRG